MSRSGYSDDIDNWELICWRGMVASSIRGKRGQQLLRDLLTALEAMPVKRLIAYELIQANGEVCALGALGKARGMDMSKIDPEEPSQVGQSFNIAPCLAQEIAYMNDDWWRHDTPEQRWERMRDWTASQIKSLEGLT